MINKRRQPLFCQFCGHHSIVSSEAESAFKCLRCEKVTYLNSKPSVCGVALRDNAVLLVTDSQARVRSWDLPGGFLLYGEAPEDGLKRELKEELNVEIQVDDLLTALVDVYGENKEITLNLFYQITLMSSDVRVQAEIVDFQWCRLESLPSLRHKSSFEVLSNLNKYF
jgi:NAD+ diphosphatase